MDKTHLVVGFISSTGCFRSNLTSVIFRLSCMVPPASLILMIFFTFGPKASGQRSEEAGQAASTEHDQYHESSKPKQIAATTRREHRIASIETTCGWFGEEQREGGDGS